MPEERDHAVNIFIATAEMAGRNARPQTEEPYYYNIPREITISENKIERNCITHA